MGLRLKLFGHPATYADERRCEFPQRKAEALLYYIALNPGPHPREGLANLWWPENANARTRLANALNSLRTQSLVSESEPDAGARWVGADRKSIWFNDGPDVSIDVTEFEALLQGTAGAQRTGPQERHRAHQAVGLYQGPFLDHFYPREANAAFDDWIGHERTRLEQMYLAALLRLALYDAAHQEHQSAIRWLSAYLEVDPFSDTARGLIMLMYTGRGDAHLARQEHDRHQQILADEGFPPSAELAAWSRQLVALDDLDAAVLLDHVEKALAQAREAVTFDMSLLMHQVLNRLGVGSYPVESGEVFRVLRTARSLAAERGFKYCGVPHLFQALLNAGDPILDEILRAARISRAEALRRIETIMGTGAGAAGHEAALSPRTEYCLLRAKELAVVAGAPAIEVPHLVRAILEDRGGLIDRLLAQYNVDTRAVLRRSLGR